VTTQLKSHEALAAAQEAFDRKADWVTFFREVLGMDGIVRRLYPSREALAEFEKTAEYAEIQAMLAKLRFKDDGSATKQEPVRVITVRMPASMHEALKDEAHTYRTTINQLCISKLVQILDSELVPNSRKT